jgi:hypothetical protein
LCGLFVDASNVGKPTKGHLKTAFFQGFGQENSKRHIEKRCFVSLACAHCGREGRANLPEKKRQW